jgi:uncharacterized membrane protein YdfJ with MMPL/SSD domain
MSRGRAFVDAYVDWLHKARYVVLGLWVILLVLAGWEGAKYLNNTTTDTNLPSSIASKRAYAAFESQFGPSSLEDIVNTLVLIQETSG